VLVRQMLMHVFMYIPPVDMAVQRGTEERNISNLQIANSKVKSKLLLFDDRPAGRAVIDINDFRCPSVIE
jgi:hypothetical protein